MRAIWAGLINLAIYTGNIVGKKNAGNGVKKNIPWDYHGMFNISGGDEGIRTLDTLASILHFQCSALDQLCDISESKLFCV